MRRKRLRKPPKQMQTVTDTKIRRAIQVSLDAESQMYVKILAKIMFTNVSQAFRTLVLPYANNEEIKDILGDLELIDSTLLSTFRLNEDETLAAIDDLTPEEKRNIASRLVKYGKTQGLDYEKLIDTNNIPR